MIRSGVNESNASDAATVQVLQQRYTHQYKVDLSRQVPLEAAADVFAANARNCGIVQSMILRSLHWKCGLDPVHDLTWKAILNGEGCNASSQNPCCSTESSVTNRSGDACDDSEVSATISPQRMGVDLVMIWIRFWRRCNAPPRLKPQII